MKIEGRWLRPEESVAISGSRQVSANCGQYSLLKPTTTTTGIVLKLALVIVEPRLVGSLHRMWAGDLVFLLFRFGDALMRTAGVASAIGINPAGMRCRRSGAWLQRTGHRAFCVNDRGHHRD